MKTAIVHEWLVNYSGSERCVESFNNIWSDARIYSLVDFLTKEERDIILKGKSAQVSFIQKLPFAKKRFRHYLPLFPFAIEQFDLSEFDVIISSSHAVAKGSITNSSQKHFCYCHTPMRYAWEMYHQYLKENNVNNGPSGLFIKLMLHRIRIWDYTTANRPDYFIANSNYVARRIKKVYNRDSEVIYPPVDIDSFNLSQKKDDYYLTVSRLVPYKKTSLIVEAFAKMPDKKLVVIGEGPELDHLKSIATKNIELVGFQTSDKLKQYMEDAKCFVFAAEEDFGIVVVEALASGTPVIALNKGGTAETIEHMNNGIHFPEQSHEKIIEAVKLFEKNIDKFDHSIIRKSSQRFSRSLFEKNFKNFVISKI